MRPINKTKWVRKCSSYNESWYREAGHKLELLLVLLLVENVQLIRKGPGVPMKGIHVKVAGLWSFLRNAHAA